MRATCFFATIACSFFIVLFASSCPTTIQQSGEGEGEGIPIGEGEGQNVGEGEGEGTVHPGGEGEGSAGEGEGAQAGEGEGEGAQAGEGEGAQAGEGEGAQAGEGEGEGTAGVKENTAAGCTQTTPTSNTCCSDNIDNDNNGFVDCKDFACAGDDHCNVGSKSIQSFMDPNGGVTPVAGVTIDKAVVTGTTTSSSGNITVYIQATAADPALSADPLPNFSGTQIFIKSGSTVAGTFAGLGIQVGDCVTASGSVDLFDKAIQLSFVTAFQKTTGCGTTPTPTAVAVSDVNDTGSKKNQLLDTLVTISNITVDKASSGNNGSFEVRDAGGATIFVSGFLMNPKPNEALSTSLTSVTGILTSFEDTSVTPPVVHFDIDPRTASDIH